MARNNSNASGATAEVAANLVASREGNTFSLHVDLGRDIGKENKNGTAVVLAETSGYRGQEIIINGEPHTLVFYLARRKGNARQQVSL